MLRVCLGKHHQLDVRRITLKVGERRYQVIDLVVGQGKAEAPVCLNQSTPATGQHRHPAEGPGLVMTEQQLGATRLMEYFLGHAVMQQGCNFFSLFEAKLAGGADVVSDTAFNSANLSQATVASDIGSLTGPRRECSRARDHQEQNTIWLLQFNAGPVGQKAIKYCLFRIGKVGIEIHKVHEFCVYMLHIRNKLLNPGVQLSGTERRERGSAAKFKHDINLYRANRGTSERPP